MSDVQETRRLPPDHPQGIRRVQVGCGPKHLREDWWNVDIRSFKGIDEAMNAAKPWRWENLLDFVYCEHFLEHLDLTDALSFLYEAGQALKNEGRIRLSTPNLEWVLKTHYSFAPGDGSRQIQDTLNTNRAFHGWGHKFLYTQSLLEWILRSMNYADIRFFNYGESDTPALRGIELHGGWAIVSGSPSVLIVEAARSHVSIVRSSAVEQQLETQYIRYVRSGH